MSQQDALAELREIVAKMTPAALEMLTTGKSGKIELHFGPSGFKFAQQTQTL